MTERNPGQDAGTLADQLAARERDVESLKTEILNVARQAGARILELEGERDDYGRALQAMVGPAGYLAQPALAPMLPLLGNWPDRARALVALLVDKGSLRPIPQVPGYPEKFSAGMAAVAAEAMRFVSANRERLVQAWLAETGCLPSQAVLVEQRHSEKDGVMRIDVHVEQRRNVAW